MATFTAIEDGTGIIAQAEELSRIEERGAWRGALRDVLRPTMQTAKELAPKDKGDLAASHQLRAIARSRRGIGVIITLRPIQGVPSAGGALNAFEDRFYATFVHYGHKFGKRGSNASIGWEFGKRARRAALAAKRLAIDIVNRGRAAFPGIPWLKWAGEMHRERMDRELKDRFSDRVRAALEKRAA